MKRFLPLFALLAAFAAAPASAAWQFETQVDGNNFWIADGTWRIKLTKSSGTTYYISTYADGGPTLDLSTVTADLAAEPTPHTASIVSVGAPRYHQMGGPNGTSKKSPGVQP